MRRNVTKYNSLLHHQQEEMQQSGYCREINLSRNSMKEGNLEHIKNRDIIIGLVCKIPQSGTCRIEIE